MKRIRDRAIKIPRELVAELAAAGSLAQQAWLTAKENDDWAHFEPHLTRLVALKRRLADAVGYADEPYDALLDEYEPGARLRELLPLFTELRHRLVRLCTRIAASSDGPRRAALCQPLAPLRQEALAQRLLQDIGFDFSAGRLDLSEHPFTEGMSPGDVRITTRYDSDDLSVSLFAVLHEGGHALYEMGLPAGADEATPAAQAVSLGIHESQSRLWECCVGRSRPFMEYLARLLRDLAPEQFSAAEPQQLYVAANAVTLTPVRINADEVTYNLHIILRLEIERALLNNEIEVADLPALWREKSEQYLGMTPQSDSEGALQDIHWAFGCFGYFPTYTLGNLYAAQFFATARGALPDLDRQLASGEFGPLRQWLCRQVHENGSLLPAAELCREVTGAALSIEPYLEYLDAKFTEIYRL
jgi:carboxypeptidase Taq